MNAFLIGLVEQWGERPGAMRLGSALLHFVWQGAICAVIAAVLVVLLKRARPQIRYLALLSILAVMTACPIVTFVAVDSDFVPARVNGQIAAESGPLAPAAVAARAVEEPTVEPDRSSPAAPITATAVPRSTAESRPASIPVPTSATWSDRFVVAGRWVQNQRQWIVAAWLAGVCVLMLRLAVGLIGAERASRRGITAAAESVREVASRIADQFGIRRTVRVVESVLAEVPTLVGWLRPVILLPASALCGLTPKQLEAILAHELAHVRRHDYLVNVMQTIVETILFYHPAVWWISREIRREREHCCDDLAVAICADRVTYARALAAMEELRVATPARWIVAAHGGSLTARIRRIVGSPEPAGSGKVVAVLGVMFIMAVAALQLRPAVSAGDPAISNTEPSATGNPESEQAGAQRSAPEQAPKKVADPKTPWSVRGRVTDGDGKPLAGVLVTAHAGNGTLRQTGKGETDAEGKYGFDFGPGIAYAKNDVQLQAATITAHKAGFFEKNLSRQGGLLAALKLPEGEVGWGKAKADVILPGQPREIDFVMLPAAKVSGTLIGKDEKPLTGYSISLKGDELPPSSSVIASGKSDGEGRFVLSDIPTGFKWQLLVEPAKREPPWNAWASGPYVFGKASGDDWFILRGDEEFAANRFELQVLGEGVNWKEALKIGAAQEELKITGDSLTGKSRVHAASVRLVLNPPGDGETAEPPTKAGQSKPGSTTSKANLRRTELDPTGRFAVTFDNPIARGEKGRLSLDPEKHQVIFQIFVKDAAGKLVEKIIRQRPAQEDGDYRVDVQVKPELFATSSVSVTFVTIQPEHDKWVQAFFHDGKGTKYSGMWIADGGNLAELPVNDDIQLTPERQYNVRVVTTQGKPVAGAKVSWQSLWAGWGASVNQNQLPSTKTDADGRATITIAPVNDQPRTQGGGFGGGGFGTRDMMTLSVDHPDHPVWSKWIAPSAAERIVLSDPATVTVRAHRIGDTALLENLYPVTNRLYEQQPDWSEGNGVLTIRRVDVTSDQAARWLRIVHVPKAGPALFSDLVDLKQFEGHAISIDAPLKSGTRVEGAIVCPQPLKNGRVVAWISSGTDSQESWKWSAETQIADDGKFEFESLPADTDLQLIALCDGWVSRSPLMDLMENYAARWGFADPSYKGPQLAWVHGRLFRLEGERIEATVPMERTSTAEVTVVDQDGQPIAGATVSFTTNQKWHNAGNLRLGMGPDFLSAIRKQLVSGEHTNLPRFYSPDSPNPFSAITNSRGIAVVPNLPPGGSGQPTYAREYNLMLTHPDYGVLPQGNRGFPPVMSAGPRSDMQSLTILPGQTGRALVRMQRK